jgi:hypothetical protein
MSFKPAALYRTSTTEFYEQVMYDDAPGLQQLTSSMSIMKQDM